MQHSNHMTVSASFCYHTIQSWYKYDLCLVPKRANGSFRNNSSYTEPICIYISVMHKRPAEVTTFRMNDIHKAATQTLAREIGRTESTNQLLYQESCLLLMLLRDCNFVWTATVLVKNQ